MKRILLYILTLSMLVTAFNFGTVPAEALVQTGGSTPSGTAISNLAGLNNMTTGNQYYLTQDIVMNGPFTFPAGITLNGNGYALLPPSGTSSSAPYGLATPVAVNGKNCLAFFRFTTGAANTVTFQNISFGKTNNVFYLKDTGSTEQASLSLFADNYNTTLVCDDVDFHVYMIDNTNAGDTAGFLGTVYGTVTMTDCNMSCVIDSLNSSVDGYASQGACYFARDNSTADITMTGCKTLKGSRVDKNGQSAGFISQLSSKLTIKSCDNYANINQAGGNHAGGFVATFDSASNLTFTKCSNYGNVKGLYAVGGFLGNANGQGGHSYTSGNPINVTFTDCLNVGDVGPQPGLGERIGGYVGRIQSIDVKLIFNNCVNLGFVSGPDKGASESWGYYYDNVGQFVGGIMAAGGKKGSGWTGETVSQPYYPNNTVTASGHPYYPKDNEWTATWHYLYGTYPVKFTNCYAYGRFSVASNVRELSKLTGTYMTDEEAKAKNTANETYNPILSNADVPHYGFMGASCMVDTTSSGNHQLLGNNSEDAKWAYASENPQALSVAVGMLNTWMTAQGKPTYILDGSSGVGTGSLKDTFAIAQPEIPAYLCTASHDTIRILGGVNTKSYSKVGFSYTLKVGSITEFATQDYWTTSIYTTVGLKTAEQLGYEYLYEMTFLNVPTSGTVTLTLIPKAVSTDGKTTYTGQTYTLTFTNGKFTKCTVT